MYACMLQRHKSCPVSCCRTEHTSGRSWIDGIDFFFTLFSNLLLYEFMKVTRCRRISCHRTGCAVKLWDTPAILVRLSVSCMHVYAALCCSGFRQRSLAWVLTENKRIATILCVGGWGKVGPKKYAYKLLTLLFGLNIPVVRNNKIKIERVQSMTTIKISKVTVQVVIWKLYIMKSTIILKIKVKALNYEVRTV
jgi:hypothetical protein